MRTRIARCGSISVVLLACATSFGQNFKKVDPPIVFGEGFYGMEQHPPSGSAWRWMGARADGPLPLKGLVSLRNDKADATLNIRGKVNLGFMVVPPTMQFFFNGELLEEFVLTSSIVDKTYLVPAAKQGQEAYSDFVITIDGFYVPREHEKGSTDVRRLGFKLTGLTWQETEAVAARPKAVVAPPEARAPAPPPAEGGPEAAAPMRIGWKIGLAIAVTIFAAVLLLAFRGRGAVSASARDPG